MPLGPSIAVRLWVVFIYEGLKNADVHHRGEGVAVMPSTSCFRLVYVKFLLTNKICNYGKIVSKKSHLKPANSHSLGISSSTVRLREVIFALRTSKCVSASTYERCPHLLQVNYEYGNGGRKNKVQKIS